MAMLALLSHFRDIDGLIGEVETCSKLLLLWPTQEQREKREKIKTAEQRRGMMRQRETGREKKNKNILKKEENERETLLSITVTINVSILTTLQHNLILQNIVCTMLIQYPGSSIKKIAHCMVL